jgi:hypothetical protein
MPEKHLINPAKKKEYTNEFFLFKTNHETNRNKQNIIQFTEQLRHIKYFTNKLILSSVC